MIQSEVLRAALQSLGANRLRTFLTALGIVIGVASVVMVVQITHGMETRILQEVRKQGGHSFRLHNWVDNPDPKAVGACPPIDEGQVRELHRHLSGILMASPSAWGGWGGRAPRLQAGSLSRTPMWTAVDEHGLELQSRTIAHGRGISMTDRLFKRPVLVVGSGLAQQLGLDASSLGRSLVYGGQTAELVGIMAPSDEPFSDEDSGSNSTVAFPFGAFREVLPQDAYEEISWQLLVSLDHTLEAAEDGLRQGLRAIRGVRSGRPDNFSLQSSADTEKEVGKVLRIVTGISALLMSLSLLVGGIGVMNIMLVSVTERTREIGVRKAMGAPQKAIRGQFLVEAILLCLLGGVIGLVLGTGAGQLISHFLFKLAGWPSLVGVTLALVVPTGVGVAFGFFPARKAARMDPIEALRYE